MSGEVIKQLKIKTSILIRLRKQYTSYEKQTKSIQQKIQTLNNQEPNQDKEINIKKNRQFLEESSTVLSNVKQKLIEAFESLVNYLKEKSDDTELVGTTQLEKAEEAVLEVQTFLEALTQ